MKLLLLLLLALWRGRTLNGVDHPIIEIQEMDD